ncbi:MAG: hypothetical protein RhofKO_05200 [Rhodothermales bacterium]
MIALWSSWQWWDATERLDAAQQLHTGFSAQLGTIASQAPADPDYVAVFEAVARLQQQGAWEQAARLIGEAQERVNRTLQASQQQQRRAVFNLLAALCVLLSLSGLLIIQGRRTGQRLVRAKRAHDQAQTATQQLDDLTEYTRIGLVVINVNGEVYQVNQAFQSITGKTAQALKADGFASCFIDSLSQRTAWAQLYHTGQRSMSTEVTMHRAGADPFWASVRYIRKAYQGMSGDLMLVLVEDIDVQRAHKQGLIAAKQRAEEMAQAKNSFLANMTHELCTPIAGILGAAGLMTDEVEDEEHQEYLHLIRESGERLLATVNAVLQLAQLESKSVRLSLDQVDIADYLRNVMRLFPSPSHKDIDVIYDWPEDPIRVNVDRVFLQRIIQNLVSNAFKYTERGTVTIGVTNQRGYAVLWVEDTGIGIESDQQQSIFQAFTQASHGHSRLHEGVGLGLTITRMQVEYMGGTIHVQSTKGKGSRFEVRLPQVGVQRLGRSPQRAAIDAA